MKAALKNFFSFTKKELNGLIVLLFLIVLIILAPYIYSALYPPEIYNYENVKKEVEEWRASMVREESKSKYQYHYRYNNYGKEEDVISSPVYFKFNPNGLSEKLWKKLGLSTRQIKVIKNFESKGGKFYRKEDLKKIYSIKEEQYAGLEPYINIPERQFGSNYPAGMAKSYPKKIFAAVELNTADSAQLETLKGIGPAFASRILKYRNRLGGFHKKEQLLEIYGFDSVKYAGILPQIDLKSDQIQKINVNTAAFEELKKYPYLNYKQVNAILQYRKQHGSYHSIADLKKIVILSEEILKKMEPYLEF